MSFETQRAQALAFLGKTGMWESSYAPPALKLLWRLGFKIPPPHFANPWSSAFVLAVWFAVVYGVLMWLFVWSDQSIAPLRAVITSVVAGALFGAFMAGYYAYGRRKYKLPSWQSLGEETTR